MTLSQRLTAVADSLNTHKVGYTGVGSIAAALVAIVAVGIQSAVDDHLVGNGFWIEAARGTYDAFVKYAALPTVTILVAGGGLAAYLGRPRNVPPGPVADTHGPNPH